MISLTRFIDPGNARRVLAAFARSFLSVKRSSPYIHFHELIEKGVIFVFLVPSLMFLAV